VNVKCSNFDLSVLLATMLLITVPILSAQSAFHLNTAYAGAVGVTGRVAQGTQEVSIYDLSYPVATKLGTSKSIDRSGSFAAIVKPALIKGHQIVAVDRNGAKSNVVVVGALPVGPAGPPKH
jgi:hypothetical protein